jgi:hypothetical protein
MSAVHNFLYFLALIALHFLFIVLWLLMRRTCFSCCPSTLDSVNSPDSQDESAAEEELQINQDETTVKSSRWVLNWTKLTHRPSKSTTNILQSVFNMELPETAQTLWRDVEHVSSSTYVALPMRLAEKLSPAELELGTFAGSSKEKYGNVFRIAKLQLAQIQVSNPSSPTYLSGDLLRHSDNNGGKKTSPACTTDGEGRPQHGASPLQTALRGRPLSSSYRSSSGQYPHTARVAASSAAVQCPLSTLTSITTAKSHRTAQRSEDPSVNAKFVETGVGTVNTGPKAHSKLHETAEAGVEDSSTISSLSVFPDVLSASALHAPVNPGGGTGDGTPLPQSLAAPGETDTAPSAQHSAPA